MPAISVVVPVYNRAGVLGRAINSVLAQDFADWELIVVDDGSTDGSAAVVEGTGDPRVKLVRLATNGGGNAARNRGIAASSAPLITFLDSDDAYLPHKLRYEVDSFAADPNLGVLLTGFRYDEQAGGARAGRLRANPAIRDTSQFAEALFLRRLRKGTPGIAARRSALDQVGGFDEGLHRRQDFDLLVRLAEVTRCQSSAAVTWVKSESADAISADRAKFIPALLAFLERHPDYYGHTTYRRGLALDLGRHLSWQLVRGKAGAIARDLSLLRAALGPLKLARVLAEAGLQYPAHRLRRRRQRRNG